MKKNNNLTIAALVGSVLSGKTSIFNYIKSHYSDTDDTIFLFGEEAATAIFNEHADADNTTASFQFMVMSKQIDAIEKAVKIAEENPDKQIILIVDRSMIDAFIYTPANYMAIFSPEFIYSVYDVIFFLESAVNYIGNTKEGNMHRRENRAEILENQKKSYEVYSKKNNVHVIPAFEDINDRIKLFDEEFKNILGIKKGAIA